MYIIYLHITEDLCAANAIGLLQKERHLKVS